MRLTEALGHPLQLHFRSKAQLDAGRGGGLKPTSKRLLGAGGGGLDGWIHSLCFRCDLTGQLLPVCTTLCPVFFAESHFAGETRETGKAPLQKTPLQVRGKRILLAQNAKGERSKPLRDSRRVA